MNAEHRGWSPVAHMSWSRSTATGSALAVGLTVLIVAMVLLPGPPPIMAPWDTFILLDGSWRILGGQTPHVDFSNAIGALTYMVGAAGMWLTAPSLGGLTFGTLLFMLITVPWAMVVFATRLNPILATASSIFLVLLMTAPRPLGYDPDITTYAMLYNRYGWTFLSVVMVWLFLEPRAPSRRVWLDGVLLGVFLCATFLCKANFFVAAVLALGLAAAIKSHVRGALMPAVVGFGAALAFAWLALGIPIVAYVVDIESAAQAQSLHDRLQRLVEGLRDNSANIASMGAVWVAAAFLHPRSARERLEFAGMAAVMAGLTMAVAVGNTGERSDLPLFFTCSVIGLEYLLRPPLGQTHVLASGRALAAVGAAVLTLLVGGLIAVRDVSALAATAKAHAEPERHRDDPQVFSAQNIRDFYIPATSDWRTAYWMARDVPARINEGLALLRQHTSADSQIFVMALTDPFSFALSLPSARGVPLWWDLNLSFDATSHPPAVELFRDVSIVMIPMLGPADPGCCKATVETLIQIYGPYVHAHFSPVASSEHWQLLKRH